MSSGGGSTTVGYKYFMGLHMGLCAGPVDAILEIRAGDRTAWSGTVSVSSQLTIDAPELFGGDEREGGIAGKLDVMMGEEGQLPNGYLAGAQNGVQPAYLGLLGVVFRKGLISANNPYIKPWAFRVRRILKGWRGDDVWYSTKAEIVLPGSVGKAMNPAHIIYECLTNDDWGLGYSPSTINETNFIAAADAFHAEGLGLCLQWLRQQPIETFIQQVLDHAGANLGQSRTSGLFELRLIRGGYDPLTLPVFDPSNIVALDSFQRPSIAEAVNEVTVKFDELSTGKEGSVTVQNLANVQAQGGVVSQGKAYPGLPTADLAIRVALRDLRAVSTPLAKVRMRVQRSAYGLLPGDLIRFTWPDLEIDSLVMRVISIAGGTLRNGEISIECVEDVFELPTNAYTQQPEVGWDDPATAPAAASARTFTEAPFLLVQRALGATAAAALDPLSGYVMAGAARPNPADLQWQLRVLSGAAYETVDRGQFCPTGVTSVALGPTDTTLRLTLTNDLELVKAATYGLIGSEWIRVDTINASTGVATIGRGVMDSVPTSHAAGSRVLFLDGFEAYDSAERLDGQFVQAKIITVSSLGALPEASAPTLTLTMDQRAARPYPPGRLRINGEAYPPAVVSDTITVSWSHRSRLQQNLQGDESTDIGPEAGTTYSLQLRKGATVVQSASGIAGTSWASPILSDGEHTIDVWSVRAGLQSRQTATHTFQVSTTQVTGWNRRWGQKWGGSQTVTPTPVPVTVSGTPTTGGTYQVNVGGSTYTYTSTAGQTNTDVATGIAGAITSGGGSATSSGPTVTVTPPPGATTTATVAPPTEIMSTTLVQAAAATSTPARDTYHVRLQQVVPGGWDTPVGNTFGFKFGPDEGALTTISAQSTRGNSDAEYFILEDWDNAFRSAGLAALYNWQGVFDWGSRRFTISGPPGVPMVISAIQGSTSVVVTWDREQVPAGTPAAVPQISTVTIDGTAPSGVRYTITLNGTPYSFTSTGVGGAGAVASGLAALIDISPDFIATADYKTVTITRAVANTPFTITTTIDRPGYTLVASGVGSTAVKRAIFVLLTDAQAVSNVDARNGLLIIKGMNAYVPGPGYGAYASPTNFVWVESEAPEAGYTKIGNFDFQWRRSAVGVSASGYTPDSEVSNPFGSIAFFLSGAGVASRVRWKGDGSSNRVISHAVGTSPALIIARSSNGVTADGRMTMMFASGAGTGKAGRKASLASSGIGFVTDPESFKAVSSSSFTVGTSLNQPGEQFVAWVFSGNSPAVKTGTYTGSGASSGPSVAVSGKIALLMIRRLDSTEEKTFCTSYILDGSRPDRSFSLEEGSATSFAIDVAFTPTGFAVMSTDSRVNAPGVSYQWWAMIDNAVITPADTGAVGPWVSQQWAVRPVCEFLGKLVAVDYGTQTGVRGAVCRLYESSNNGTSWSSTYQGMTAQAGSFGSINHDFVVGSNRISWMRNLDAGVQLAVQAATTGEGTQFQGYPRAGSDPIDIGAMHCDGTTVTVIARKSDNSQPHGKMYTYTSTDGLNFTLAGEAVQSPSDPNSIAGLNGEWTANYFVPLLSFFRGTKSTLKKISGRWFLIGEKSIYYTDSASATTGWLRAPLNLNEGASNPTIGIQGLEQVGSKLVAWKSNVGVGADVNNVAHSSDNGATWTAMRPLPLTAPTDTLGIGWVLGGVLHIVENSTGQILRCSDPAGTWTRTAPTGITRIIYALVSGSRVLVVDSTTSSGAVLRYSSDGVNFTASTGI